MANKDFEVTPELTYRDPKAALEWLTRAFGFETTLLITGADGKIVIARTECGDNAIMIGPEHPKEDLSPASIGGTATQSLQIRFAEDIDAHFARARAAGAKVLYAPRQEFYGDKTYAVLDPEGHRWSFGQRDAAPVGPPPEG